MSPSAPTAPQLPLPRSLRLVGLTGAAIGLATVLGSTAIYAQQHAFSFLTTYLSDVGNTPDWPATLFNSGMLVLAPLRYLFLVLLLALFNRLGQSAVAHRVGLTVGLLAVIGSAGTAAVPFSLHRELHMGAAFLYFFGTVVLQGFIAWQEWRLRVPRLLPLLSLLVVVIYLVFAVLLVLVGKVPFVTRETPVPWEWLAFASLMLWLLAHSLMLGAVAPPQGEASGETSGSA